MNNIISERDAEQQEVELASSNPKETIIDTTKEALLAELKEAHSIDKKVATFAKVMDSYGLDPILGFFTWGVGTSLVATLYLLSQGSKIWLSRKEKRKIAGYQAADLVLGIIPFVDFFFQANKYSAKLFEEHLKRLEQIAIEKWLPQEEVDKLKNENIKTLKLLTNRDNDKEEPEKPAIAA